MAGLRFQAGLINNSVVVAAHLFFLAGAPFLILTRFPHAGIGRVGWEAVLSAVLVAGLTRIYSLTFLDLVRTGGTPATWDPPAKLVQTGLYRCTRNPMYASMVLLLVVEAVYFKSAALLAYAAALFLGFHLFVVFHEEPALRRKFGDAYEVYRRGVPRWGVPGLSAKRISR